MTEDKVQMAAQMYDMRDKAKRLLGDKYKKHMAALGELIKDIARQRNQDVLSVTIFHCKRQELTGMDLILTMAACVELLEPSE